MKRQQGFTLIELMIVVAIIGILAAIAIPQYQNYVARSEMSEATTLAGGLKTDVAEFYNIHGTITGANSATGQIPAASDVSGKYVNQVAVADGVITATMGNSSASSIDGKTLTLTPGKTASDGSFTALSGLAATANVGSISWKCKSDAAPQYLPSNCTSTAGN